TGLHAEGAGSGLNLGVIKVPDARVDALARIYEPRKTTYAEVSFVDFPPARSAPERRTVLDAATVAQLRDADALVEVLRGFPDVAGAPPTRPRTWGASPPSWCSPTWPSSRSASSGSRRR